MNKKLLFLVIILIIIMIIILKNKEYYNDDIISRQALNTITSVYAESYDTVYFNNQYTTGDLLVGNNLYVDGSFNLLPHGVIVAYNSSVAPYGWAICDGTNGTPDLRGRFILGQNKDQPEVSPAADDGGKPKLNQGVRVGSNLAANLNTTGGEVYHILTMNELPPNTATSDINGQSILLSGKKVIQSVTQQAHNILPPFYVLTYIMKL